MMLSCNRFALVPHLCSECKNYIWLEGYRRAEVWHKFADRYIMENICKNCLTKFDVGKEKKIMDKCPICKYRIDQCQCRFCGGAHPDRDKRRKVVLDHLYLLSETQLTHVIELERCAQASYTDQELSAIFDEMKEKSNGVVE